MSEREYFYNTETDEYVVAFLTVNASNQQVWAVRTIDGTIDIDGAYNLADNDSFIKITKDNADLFIDHVQEYNQAIKQELEANNAVILLLEGILED